MDAAQRTLCEVVAAHGPAIALQPRRLRNLLNDLCGDQPRAVFVLATAAEARVPADLEPAVGRDVSALQRARAAARLSDGYGFAPGVAQWAVETWALALGMERGGPEPIVAGDGPGARYRTLVEALRHAPPWARVTLLPGTYAEPVVLDRPVEIVSASPGAAVLESAASTCLRLESDYALLEGVTLRAAPGDAHPLFVVDVPRGELVLEDCDVSAGELACVALRGRRARVTLRRCRLHGGRLSGAYVSLGASCDAEGCDFSDNGAAGLEVGAGGSATLRDCRLRGNGAYGVRVYPGGSATVESCDLAGNRLGAWLSEEDVRS